MVKTEFEHSGVQSQPVNNVPRVQCQTSQLCTYPSPICHSSRRSLPSSRTCFIRAESGRKCPCARQKAPRLTPNKGNRISATIESPLIDSRDSLSPAVPPSRSRSPFTTPNPGSSQKSLPVTRSSSPSPSRQTWTLDQDFLRQVNDWNATHPESIPGRIMSGIHASIEQHKDLFELIPDGPIPFRGFVKALAHLIQLGVVSYSACMYPYY